jgi:hypothetical protein
LKELFANIIIFKKKLDEHFENSTKHKTKAISVLNTKGNEAHIEAKHGHGLSSLETLFLTKLSLKKWKGFWQPRAHQAVEEGMRNERRGDLFIEKIRHQLSVGPADVRQP